LRVLLDSPSSKMSFFSKIFGGKKDEAPTPGQAIQKLRETEDMLIKKQDFYEKKIEQEISLAKKNASKNKRAALQALKRKKRFEKILQQIDGTLTTIELQREALEGASTNSAVLESMKNAAGALKAAHKFDVDDVHNVLDDIAEGQEVANEIANAISNPIGFGDDIDDEELENELEELEQQGLEEDLIGVPSTDQLPSVPAGEVVKPKPARKVEDDDDMRQLEAWAS